MKNRSKLFISIMIVFLALGGIANTAFAQGGPDPQPAPPMPVHRFLPGVQLRQMLIDAFAQALNMSPDELLQTLHQGKSPEELIQQRQMDQTAVIEALQQAWNTEGKRVIDQFIKEGLPPARAPHATLKRQWFHDRQWTGAMAKALGMKPVDVVKALHSGQTLEEIAQAQGKSVQDLFDAIIAAEKAHLDQAVADGKITPEQAEEALNHISEKAKTWLDRGVLTGKRPIRMARTSTFWIKLAAESLNIPADEFVKALRQGQTPAQIAEAHGVSGQALIDAMLQIQRRQLEEVVKAGNMKHQRMERILADQSKALKKWVKKGPPPPRGNR